MTVEEKARAYDEALRKIRILQKIIGDATLGNLVLKNEFENIFPELKESEDEKIRKALRERIIRYDPNNEILIKEEGISQKQFLAWLENQNEKTEPIAGFVSEFEKQVSHLIASAINREHEYNKGYVKWAAQSLIEYAKREIEKQEEKQTFWEKCNHCEYFDGYDICLHKKNFGSVTNESKENCGKNNFFIENQGEQKNVWSKEDENVRLRLINYLSGNSHLSKDREDGINWLKSIRPQAQWKPSEEQMKVLRYLDEDIPLNDFDKRVLHVLIEQLNKLKE